MAPDQKQLIIDRLRIQLRDLETKHGATLKKNRVLEITVSNVTAERDKLKATLGDHEGLLKRVINAAVSTDLHAKAVLAKGMASLSAEVSSLKRQLTLARSRNLDLEAELFKAEHGGWKVRVVQAEGRLQAVQRERDQLIHEAWISSKENGSLMKQIDIRAQSHRSAYQFKQRLADAVAQIELAAVDNPQEKLIVRAVRHFQYAAVTCAQDYSLSDEGCKKLRDALWDAQNENTKLKEKIEEYRIGARIRSSEGFFVRQGVEEVAFEKGRWIQNQLSFVNGYAPCASHHEAGVKPFTTRKQMVEWADLKYSENTGQLRLALAETEPTDSFAEADAKKQRELRRVIESEFAKSTEKLRYEAFHAGMFVNQCGCDDKVGARPEYNLDERHPYHPLRMVDGFVHLVLNEKALVLPRCCVSLLN